MPVRILTGVSAQVLAAEVFVRVPPAGVSAQALAAEVSVRVLPAEVSARTLFGVTSPAPLVPTTVLVHVRILALVHVRILVLVHVRILVLVLGGVLHTAAASDRGTAGDATADILAVHVLGVSFACSPMFLPVARVRSQRH